MVLDKARKGFDIVILPLAKLFINVNPNAISVISLLFAILAGISFGLSRVLALPKDFYSIPIIIIIGSLCVVVSGILDLVDGKVARLTNKVSRKGDFLDHVIDRYSDTIIIIGIAFSGFIIWPLGFLAIASILIASYMGTQAQALGLGRDYKGVMGRADRIVCLIFFPVFHLAIFPFIDDGNLLFFLKDGSGWIFTGFFEYIDYRFTILDLLMLIFIVGGQWTAIQRARAIWKGLGEEEKKQGKNGKKESSEDDDE